MSFLKFAIKQIKMTSVTLVNAYTSLNKIQKDQFKVMKKVIEKNEFSSTFFNQFKSNFEQYNIPLLIDSIIKSFRIPKM